MTKYLIQRWQESVPATKHHPALKGQWTTFTTVTESADVRCPQHKAMDLANEFARHSRSKWRVVTSSKTIIHETK